MSKIRIAVIGAGAVTSTIHLPILTRRSDLFSIEALFDLNLEFTLSRRPGGCITITRYRCLLRKTTGI